MAKTIMNSAMIQNEIEYLEKKIDSCYKEIERMKSDS